MKNGHSETQFNRTDIIFSQYRQLKTNDKLKFLQEVDRASYFIEPYSEELALALALLGKDLACETQCEMRNNKIFNRIHRPSSGCWLM